MNLQKTLLSSILSPQPAGLPLTRVLMSALLTVILLTVGAGTAFAQSLELRDSSSTATEENLVTPSLIPPLPSNQPRLAPPVTEVQPQPQPVANVSTAGRTGYGYGQSPIGVGADILSNPDDMDLRSTAIDLSLVQDSEHFVMPDVAADERWIRIDLGNQQVVAYQGDAPQRAFVVSTGVPRYQTVTGQFRIQMKVSEQTMSGADYYLPGVKWVQYFYAEYAIHGTYWHSDFGMPKSHGCVNMTNADAKWLFDWAGPVWDQKTVWFRSTEENPGTRVLVHQ